MTLMGPPRPGPVVTIHGKGVFISMVVNDDTDEEIVGLVMQLAQRRRYSIDAALAAKEK